MSQNTNDVTRFTFLDVLKRLDVSEEALLLGNALAQTNEILDDLLIVQANEYMVNRVGKYTSLGQASRRRANQGFNPSKAGVEDQVDAASIWADRIAIDEFVLARTPDRSGMIEQELMAKRDNLNIQMAYDLFYGNPALTLDSMLGIAPRLNSTQIPTVISAGGATACTSMYLLTHEKDTFMAWYPATHPGGIKYINRGPNQPITDSAGKTFYGEVHDLEWALGISLKNERRCARVANIATGSLSNLGAVVSGGTANGPDLIDLAIRAMSACQNVRNLNKDWYVNRTVLSFIARQFKAQANHWITRQEIEGEGDPIFRILGVPVKLVEQITNSETVVSA